MDRTRSFTQTNTHTMTHNYDKKLARLLRRGRTIRVLGVDDVPFDRGQGVVNWCGCVCAGTRFEGMLWGQVEEDGFDATRVLTARISASKFLPQVHVILLDGIALGGFNVVDIQELSTNLERPVVAVTRRMPDLDRVFAAIQHTERAEERWHLVQKAGKIWEYDAWCFQTAGLSSGLCHEIMVELTDRGHVPEALRLSHLIGGAVMLGESGRRA